MTAALVALVITNLGLCAVVCYLVRAAAAERRHLVNAALAQSPADFAIREHASRERPSKPSNEPVPNRHPLPMGL